MNVHNISQIYGALRSYELPSFVVQDSIVFCSSEDEVTVVALYEVAQIKNAFPQLQPGPAKLITSGARDVAESFLKLVETKIGSIESQLMQEEVRLKFLRNLKDGRVKNMRIPGLKPITVQPNQLQNDVYLPVFSDISKEILELILQTPSRTFLLLSGVLAECEFLHSHIRSVVKQHSSNPEVIFLKPLKTRSTCFCEGAVLLEPSATHFIDGELELVVTSSQPTHSYFSSGHAFAIQQLEDSLRKIVEKCGYRSEITKNTVLALENAFQVLEAPDIFTEHCWEFYGKYCEEARSDLTRSGLADERTNLTALHLAAALNDTLALRIGLIAGFSVNEWSSGLCTMSPLHACIYYNDEAKDMVEVLLNSGAQTRDFAHDCPIHLATARNQVETLALFERRDREFFQGLLPDLLQLAFMVSARNAAKYLISLGAADLRSKNECSSQFILYRPGLFWPRSWETCRPRAPLETVFERLWVEEAALILKRRIERHSPNFKFHSTLTGSHSTDERPRLLAEWIRFDPFWKGEEDKDALYWAVRLGYGDLVHQICASKPTTARILSALDTAAEYARNEYATEMIGSVKSFNESGFLHLLRKRAWAYDDTATRRLIAKTLDLEDWYRLRLPNVTECAFTRALDLAIDLDLKKVVKILLDSVGSSWNENAKLLLKWAVSNDRKQIVQSLFSGITSPNWDGKDHILESPEAILSAFNWATQHGDDDLAEILLQPAFPSLLQKSDFTTEIKAKDKKTHTVIARFCLKLMSTLKKDICSLGSSDKSITDIEPGQLEKCLPTELRYACLHWISHTTQSGMPLTDHGEVHTFLLGHFLHWLEALGLLRKLPEGIRAITSLESIVTANGAPSLLADLHDAKLFMQENQSTIEQALLQLYCVALVFPPEESLVRQNNREHRKPHWIAESSKVPKHCDSLKTLAEESTAKENKRREALAIARGSVMLRDPLRPYTVTQAERERYQRLVLGMTEKQIVRANAWQRR